MAKIIGRLRIYRSPGSPTVAMTATASDSEICSIISNLGFRTAPIILKSSPVQHNLKFVTIRRPPNVAGGDGYEGEHGDWHPGYLTLLRRIYLDEYTSSVRNGRAVQKAVIFCRYTNLLQTSYNLSLSLIFTSEKIMCKIKAN